MTNQDSETTDGVNRRRMLKGTAAAGLAGGALTGTASATANELTVQGKGEVAEYRFTVTGQVTETGGVPGGSEDRVINDGQTAVGRVAGTGTDTFDFTGEIVSFEWVKGEGKVFVNGERVTFDEELTNKITIEAGDERVSYKFRVSGRVEKGSEAGTLGVDTIDDNVVRGKVGGTGPEGNSDPVDDYVYSGAIAFDEADGPLTVTLDINPD